jgi:GNAT superfamily N-acetyltransferase
MKPLLVSIRPLTPHEFESWRPLWDGYLAFYGTTLEEEITRRTWNRFHDPAEPLHLLGAYREDELVGFVTYVFHRSTWARENYCYLEDLFVSETARGLGAGKALIQAVCDQAREASAERVYWNTRESNETARRLYDSLADLTDFVQYRIPP